MLLERIAITKQRNSFLLFIGFFCLCSPLNKQVSAQNTEPIIGNQAQVQRRVTQASAPAQRSSTSFALMSPQDRRQAIDAYWGPGPSTTVKLQIFDKYWLYVDQKFAAFQGINVDWKALRDRYRPEVAAGVSRGRFAAIMNQLALALRDAHTAAQDLDVNAFTVPEAGVPLLAVGDVTFNQSGACSTALDDGSALVYSAIPGHPLGLQPGDRVLGYDGRPWRELYQELLREEIPLWPLYWGSAPSSFNHVFVSSATMNWHLFQTMDIAKSSGQIVHVPTSLMPGALWYGFCSEQMSVPGVAKPVGTWESDTVSSGIIQGTDIGYIYVFAWGPNSESDFVDALVDLTQVRQVSGLIVDFRFNAGGFLYAPLRGIGVLFPHPVPSTGIDERMNLTDHFKMKKFSPPSEFNLDFEGGTSDRIKISFDGPIALLVGPGAASTGDMSSLWMTFHPRVRTFGKTTASTFNLPTQPALGTELNLGPDWWARIAEANFYRVGTPHNYLTHSEFPIDEHVWLTPGDVAVGKDTVVEAATRWINQQP
jgi:peptidase S41-like protein/tricorn protease-like protein